MFGINASLIYYHWHRHWHDAYRHHCGRCCCICFFFILRLIREIWMQSLNFLSPILSFFGIRVGPSKTTKDTHIHNVEEAPKLPSLDRLVARVKRTSNITFCCTMRWVLYWASMRCTDHLVRNEALFSLLFGLSFFEVSSCSKSLFGHRIHVKCIVFFFFLSSVCVFFFFCALYNMRTLN